LGIGLVHNQTTWLIDKPHLEPRQNKTIGFYGNLFLDPGVARKLKELILGFLVSQHHVP
jgi:hypothetical protein